MWWWRIDPYPSGGAPYRTGSFGLQAHAVGLNVPTSNQAKPEDQDFCGDKPQCPLHADLDSTHRHSDSQDHGAALQTRLVAVHACGPAALEFLCLTGLNPLPHRRFCLRCPGMCFGRGSRRNDFSRPPYAFWDSALQGGTDTKVFFFKQKTAYEIYQCDWSSDVCSSDLR